jgi:hypothetical protein
MILFFLFCAGTFKNKNVVYNLSFTEYAYKQNGGIFAAIHLTCAHV